jgi:hypothetical protein
MATKRRSTSTPDSGSGSSAEFSPRGGRSRNGSTAGANGKQQALGEVQAQVVAAGAAAAAAPRTTRKRTSKPKTVPVSVLSSDLPEIVPSTAGQGMSERERIALLAYSLWEARGGQGGSPEEDWYRAEEEVRRQRNV